MSSTRPPALIEDNGVKSTKERAGPEGRIAVVKYTTPTVKRSRGGNSHALLHIMR
jgi:hypothetical protein